MTLTLYTLPCSYDGEMRYGISAAAQPAKATVLILPGWGEWIEKYTDVIREWNDRGFDVLIAEWRGQGLSSRFLMDRNKSWLPSFDLLIDDLDRLFKTRLLNEKNILLFCHSMGAHLGLRWYLERGRARPAIKGVMLASMLHGFKTAPIPSYIAKALIYSATWLGLDQAYAIDQKDFDQASGLFETNPLTHDRAHFDAMKAHLRENPQLKVGGATYGWLHALMQSIARLETDLARGAPRIPYFIMGPADDPLVESSGFIHVASMLPNCEMHYLNGAKHELLQEKEVFRKQAWNWVDGFIAKIKF
ncbi:MAG: alpha/beta hydrolase [Alphaproteobacteria bacterium]|nr:alpha/beta hydrolase [Alphaproteobacteria bacterium]